MVNNIFKVSMPFSRKYYDCKIAKCIVKNSKLCVIVSIVSNLLIVITNHCTTRKKFINDKKYLKKLYFLSCICYQIRCYLIINSSSKQQENFEHGMPWH